MMSPHKLSIPVLLHCSLGLRNVPTITEVFKYTPKQLYQRHPILAQLVERRTVEVQWSLGRWFESGRSDFWFFTPVWKQLWKAWNHKKVSCSQWEGSACNREGFQSFYFLGGGAWRGPVFFLLRSWGVKREIFAFFFVPMFPCGSPRGS